MTDTVVESEAFHAYELAGWQGAVQAYHDHFRSLTSQAIGPLLDMVRANQTASLLDMATGPGYVAAAAQRRGAKVIAIDFSEQMIAKARYLYPFIDFRIGDAESLTFDDGQFD